MSKQGGKNREDKLSPVKRKTILKLAKKEFEKQPDKAKDKSFFGRQRQDACYGVRGAVDGDGKR